MRSLIAVLILLSAAGVQAQQTVGPYISVKQVDDLNGPSSAPAEPFTVVGNLHYVGADNISSWLITTPEGHILIDTGTTNMEKVVRSNIEKLGFKLSDIKIMLSGHAHFDHVAGHAAMQKATGARVMALGADAKALELGRDISPVETVGWEPVKVERVLSDGDTVTLGGTTLRAVWTPGHTPGCTTWVTTIQEGGRNYNVVILGSIGPNPGPPMVGNPKFPTLAEDTLGTINKLRALNPDIQLGGHMRAAFAGKIPAIKGKARPHPLQLEPGQWKRYLDTQEANYLKRIEADKAKLK
jgi:metallo-beta-lactamase class B